MARPSKLTDERREAICQALRDGNYAETAARMNGIGVSTFYRWMEQGEADHEHDKQTAHREFWEGVKSAEAEAEANAVRMVRVAMIDSWQAAMTYLERKYPERWGRRDATKVELSGSIKQEQVTVPEDGERAREVAALLAGTGAVNGNGKH